MNPTDEEIDQMVKWLCEDDPHMVHMISRGGADMLLALQARVEAAEKREAELREEVRGAIIKLSSKMRGTWLEYTIHAFRKIIADLETKP